MLIKFTNVQLQHPNAHRDQSECIIHVQLNAPNNTTYPSAASLKMYRCSNNEMFTLKCLDL